MRIWNKIREEAWAITASSLHNILDIAARNNEAPHVVAARLGKELQNTYTMNIRDGVAILPVVGALFRYANLFTNISGASSYEIIGQDFRKAIEDDQIKAIILDIDSPGGEVNGCAELADMIFEKRGKKPIIAYASGDAASGAYWIAAACDKIIVSKTSALGSIGVVGVYQNNSNEKEVEIVSSQSPYKQPDLASDEGKIRLQARIDTMAQVFIESIAKYRGISAQEVISNYGAGDVFIGETAVEKGLADYVGSYEKILTELNQDNHTLSLTNEDKKIMHKESREQNSDFKSIEEMRLEERKRIEAILNSKAAENHMELARHFAFATDIEADIAIAALTKVVTTDNTSFISAMQNIKNPKIIPSTDADADADDINALAKRIASY
ncbi:hypothetical protein I862_04320 [endosymbiont of Acanthamoeba sp. UWC8]|uniref:S49 family peptidase n=1 Tax=endosymbiont of Acanthamoeba sp. UWC8 TaxID=86106 RepID=UPI0004D1AC33|nr:S49 family peptidase [endosymbiont of Acanthamoeba sp. UWC8]AIF81424.1 hypothetical protein I862_04320 [endosymbiont of Acanthamoeba sp. UWC8]